jgi:hypothetical protein
MALKQLIENQTLIIDDHKKGSGEVKNWDEKSIDIHIDKLTHYKIEGKRQQIRIKIPLNSERPIKIENSNKKQLDRIPRQLISEIKTAFENKHKRESFIKDIVNHIRNYSSILENEQKIRQVLSNISKHFDLKWTNEKIATYTKDTLVLYTETFTDNEGKNYFITASEEDIKIGETTSYSRHQKYLIENKK